MGRRDGLGVGVRMRRLWIVVGYWSRGVHFTAREGTLKENWEWYAVELDNGTDIDLGTPRNFSPIKCIRLNLEGRKASFSDKAALVSAHQKLCHISN